MEKGFWVGTIIVVIIIGITAGIIVHIYQDTKVEKSTLADANELSRMKEEKENIIIDEKNKKKIGSENSTGIDGENNVLSTSSSDEKTTPNTVLIFECYYSKCGHSQISSKKIDSENVNKTKEEIEKIYGDWKIKSFSSEKIELYKEENSICSNHFVVKEDDGYVAVYNINNDGQEIIRDKTDISTKYLPQDDQDLLQNGIKANSASELDQILADFE